MRVILSRRRRDAEIRRRISSVFFFPPRLCVSARVIFLWVFSFFASVACLARVSSLLRSCLYISVLGTLACQQPPARPDVQSNLADNPPQLLSAWRLFELDAHSFAPARDGIVYELNTPLFSDYAHKLRSIHLPKDKKMRFDSDTIELPVGTLITKTFYYDLADAMARDRTVRETPQREATTLDTQRVRLLETRLLINTPAGWVALPYVWNEAQTDARLELAGESLELTLHRSHGAEPFVYEVPDGNQCAGCHTLDQQQRRIEPIGIKPRHLNRIGHDGDNQLIHWSRQSLLLDVPTVSREPRNAKWNDLTETLESRVRAYLDVNCGHCHSETGPANTSGLFLDAAESDSTKLGICKVPVATGRGAVTGTFDIVPGAPDESILLLRMLSTEPDIAMPELGRSLIHEEGAALIRDWIASLPGQCE